MESNYKVNIPLKRSKLKDCMFVESKKDQLFWSSYLFIWMLLLKTFLQFILCFFLDGVKYKLNKRSKFLLGMPLIFANQPNMVKCNFCSKNQR